MPPLSAGEAKNQERNCQGGVLDFDLSKQRCSPTSAPGGSDGKSSGAFGFCLFYEIMRSRGKRVVCVSHYDFVSEVFDGLGDGACCQILRKIGLQATLSWRKMIPITFCDRN